MKNKHPKRTQARKLLSKEELLGNVSPFLSKAWEIRKQQTRVKVNS